MVAISRRQHGYGIWQKDENNLPIKTKTDKIALVLPDVQNQHGKEIP